MRRIYGLNASELQQLGLFLGIKIDILIGSNKDKRTALVNYITYGGLQEKVCQWFRIHYGIAISYSYSRECWAIELKERLILKGYNAVIDQSHIDFSGRCISSFEVMLSEQPIFIGILNDKYFESLNCMKELYLFCSKYNFDTNIACKHFIAIWDGDLHLSISKINKIANSWKNKIEQHNKLVSNHNCSIREKLMIELDWYAKIYHQCTNILLMIKDISAIIVKDGLDVYFPVIEGIIYKKTNLLYDSM